MALELFTGSHKGVEQVGTDKVVFLHFLDDTPVMKRVILYSTMVLEDVLDHERLRSSLEKLVSRETWQKLGARLRYDVSLF